MYLKGPLCWSFLIVQGLQDGGEQSRGEDSAQNPDDDSGGQSGNNQYRQIVDQ